MPFLIPEHEAERAILKERLSLLKLCDDLLRAGFVFDDLEDPVVQARFADFSKVLNPYDVCEAIRQAYSHKPHLFGDPSSKTA